MKKVSIVIFAGCALGPGIALAQEQPEVKEQHGIPAASNSFELGVGSAYTQGFGNLRSGVGMPQVASAGIGFDLSLGYRIDPRWSVSLDGEYYELTPERGDGARGMTATAAGTYHIMPQTPVDPWVQLGIGYRGLWETSNGPTVYSGGIQAVRARAGVDFRFSPAVALGPVIGADVNVFTDQNAGDGRGGFSIDNRTASTFIYAGLQGRFDMGGTATSSASASASAASSNVARR